MGLVFLTAKRKPRGPAMTIRAAMNGGPYYVMELDNVMELVNRMEPYPV